jgi:GTP-binding protein
MIDATEPISSVDKKLARYIIDNLKPCILLINKWDLAKGQMAMEDYHEYLEKVLPAMPLAPLCFVTAKEGKNVHSAVDLAIELFKQASTRVSTAQMNKALQEVLSQRGPGGSKRGGKLPKIYYATQAQTNPPQIVLFVNDPKLIGASYQRYLENHLGRALPFSEVPIELVLRSHHEENGYTRVRR